MSQFLVPSPSLTAIRRLPQPFRPSSNVHRPLFDTTVRTSLSHASGARHRHTSRACNSNNERPYQCRPSLTSFSLPSHVGICGRAPSSCRLRWGLGRWGEPKRSLLAGLPCESRSILLIFILNSFPSASENTKRFTDEFCEALIRADLPRMKHAAARAVLFAGEAILLRIAARLLETAVCLFPFLFI
jgi:hypothetical protein